MYVLINEATHKQYGPAFKSHRTAYAVKWVAGWFLPVRVLFVA